MKLSRKISSAAVAAAALLLPLGLAAPASALDWHPIEGHDGMVLATCEDGSQILSGIGKGRYAEQPLFDADGNMTGLVLMLKYFGEFVHSTTGQTIEGRGTDRIVFDFVNGTDTSTGGRWTVTIAGAGWVIKEAGRITHNLADGAVIDYSGVNSGDWATLCPFFGVED